MENSSVFVSPLSLEESTGATFMRVCAFALTFAAAVACTRSAAAHEKPSYPVDGADENLTVTLPLVDTSPIIDGALGEGEWENAVRLSSFRRCWTFRGAPAMVQTTVYLMGGDGRLYVAFECEIDDQEWEWDDDYASSPTVYTEAPD